MATSALPQTYLVYCMAPKWEEISIHQVNFAPYARSSNYKEFRIRYPSKCMLPVVALEENDKAKNRSLKKT
jgi:hypothetical protein